MFVTRFFNADVRSVKMISLVIAHIFNISLLMIFAASTANFFAMVTSRGKLMRSAGRCHTDSEAVLPLCFIDVHIKTGRFLSVPVTKLHILPIQ